MRKLLAEPRRMGSWRGRRRPAYAGRCWHTVRNTSPIDNLTVAGGNFATQPTIPPRGALHTGYGACAPKAPKLITAMGSRFVVTQRGPGRQPWDRAIPWWGEWIARRAGAPVSPSSADLVRFALGRWVGLPATVKRAGSTAKLEAEGCPPAQGVFDQGSGTAAPLHVP